MHLRDMLVSIALSLSLVQAPSSAIAAEESASIDLKRSNSRVLMFGAIAVSTLVGAGYANHLHLERIGAPLKALDRSVEAMETSELEHIWELAWKDARVIGVHADHPSHQNDTFAQLSRKHGTSTSVTALGVGLALFKRAAYAPAHIEGNEAQKSNSTQYVATGTKDKRLYNAQRTQRRLNELVHRNTSQFVSWTKPSSRWLTWSKQPRRLHGIWRDNTNRPRAARE